jgi:hypothetical protein
MNSPASKPKLDYWSGRLPRAAPEGKVFAHNFVRPVARRNGTRGSGFWTMDAPAAARYGEPCGCGWAPELGVHYGTQL